MCWHHPNYIQKRTKLVNYLEYCQRPNYQLVYVYIYKYLTFSCMWFNYGPTDISTKTYLKLNGKSTVCGTVQFWLPKSDWQTMNILRVGARLPTSHYSSNEWSPHHLSLWTEQVRWTHAQLVVITQTLLLIESQVQWAQLCQTGTWQIRRAQGISYQTSQILSEHCPVQILISGHRNLKVNSPGVI